MIPNDSFLRIFRAIIGFFLVCFSVISPIDMLIKQNGTIQEIIVSIIIIHLLFISYIKLRNKINKEYFFKTQKVLLKNHWHL